LGIAYRGGKYDKLWAAVGFQSPGEKIRVNFGENPFLFTFEARTTLEIPTQVVFLLTFQAQPQLLSVL